mmetsp:Transcript_73947/g.186368  ORF Transcript_73947/g.186368 Transcript_73947/m.186368 type:complete len:219 (-) Transcript_73947:175-831(-)
MEKQRLRLQRNPRHAHRLSLMASLVPESMELLGRDAHAPDVPIGKKSPPLLRHPTNMPRQAVSTVVLALCVPAGVHLQSPRTPPQPMEQLARAVAMPHRHRGSHTATTRCEMGCGCLGLVLFCCGLRLLDFAAEDATPTPRLPAAMLLRALEHVREPLLRGAGAMDGCAPRAWPRCHGIACQSQLRCNQLARATSSSQPHQRSSTRAQAGLAFLRWPT